MSNGDGNPLGGLVAWLDATPESTPSKDDHWSVDLWPDLGNRKEARVKLMGIAIDGCREAQDLLESELTNTMDEDDEPVVHTIGKRPK